MGTRAEIEGDLAGEPLARWGPAEDRGGAEGIGMADNEGWIDLGHRWASAAWEQGARNIREAIDGWNGLSFFEQAVVSLLIVGIWLGARILTTLEARKSP